MSAQRLCGSVDPDTFFPDGRGDRAARVAYAQAICLSCPALRQCAAEALRLGITQGIVASVDLGHLSEQMSPAAKKNLQAVAAGYVLRPAR
ncbi:WhiB family transcriptional regulator [Nocardia sp. NPDC006044]|uniref:WhiB family transcriptional regulator n=1 Tax=Nocardia sp. NPDC006044 TaxID=3364306 RepID=UPI0036B63923